MPQTSTATQITAPCIHCGQAVSRATPKAALRDRLGMASCSGWKPHAVCGEQYCTGHDADGCCIYAEHVEWCTGRHNRDGDCIAPAGRGVEVIGSTLAGGTLVGVEATVGELADLDALIATLIAVRATYGEHL